MPHRPIACAIALATGLGFIGVMSLLLTTTSTGLYGDTKLLFVALCGDAFTWSDA